jgi:hypothetical protein
MEDPAALNPRWRKSSYSGQSGGSSCVEVGAIPWRKSSHSSQSGGGSCVEAGHVPGAVLIRDTTQDGHGPVVRVSAETWRAFTQAVRTGVAVS